MWRRMERGEITAPLQWALTTRRQSWNTRLIRRCSSLRDGAETPTPSSRGLAREARSIPHPHGPAGARRGAWGAAPAGARGLS